MERPQAAAAAAGTAAYSLASSNLTLVVFSGIFKKKKENYDILYLQNLYFLKKQKTLNICFRFLERLSYHLPDCIKTKTQTTECDRNDYNSLFFCATCIFQRRL